MLTNLLGGIGLFLLGMILLTEGLKSLAGDALRGVLSRLTGGVLPALATGAGVTALVQSSSATTLTTIGFVSAGLLSFPQAVGVIFGANVGTTSTSWIVATLGLKLSMSKVALPLVGLGALGQLLGRERIAAAGRALAGFGLVFVGIDTLQAGMATLSVHLTPEAFPGDTFLGRLALVGLGAAMTVVMQSSSAATATTLAALHAGTIHLPQAAALVIGQNVGTTVTAGLAALGATVPARRTALAHVLFNAVTGVVAFALLGPFVKLVDWSTESALGGDDTVTLAAFHTAFNLLGVLLFLPFVQVFSRWVERLVPERRSPLAQNLDPSVARVPAVAVDAARRTLRAIEASLARIVARRLRGEAGVTRELEAAAAALADLRAFLALVRSEPESEREHAGHLSALHATDHLERLAAALRSAEQARIARTDPACRALIERLLPALAPEDGRDDERLARVASATEAIAELRRAARPSVLERTARGELDPAGALRALEAMRWVDRLAYHSWRALHHLASRGEGSPTRGERPEHEQPDGTGGP